MSKAASLLKANKADSKAKRSSVPSEPPSSFNDTVALAYERMNEAEAAYRAVENELVTKAQTIYADNANAGNFSKSYNFPGVETAGVQISFKDSFTAIPADNEEALKEIMGDKYGMFFEEKRELALADTSDANVDLLIEKLGEELFLKMFKIKLSITAKTDMDRKQFELPEKARVYVKQYKPSVKLAK